MILFLAYFCVRMSLGQGFEGAMMLLLKRQKARVRRAGMSTIAQHKYTKKSLFVAQVCSDLQMSKS